MKVISIHGRLFGEGEKQYGRKQTACTDSVYEFEVPDSLNERDLTDYLEWRLRYSDVLVRVQFRALLQLLVIADQNGHNINHILLVATASGYRRVVYDHHLEPKQAPTQ